MRVRVVDEEDVAGLDRVGAPPEQEPPGALEAERDLEVLVPVHPVAVAVGPVVDDGQREVGVERPAPS